MRSLRFHFWSCLTWQVVLSLDAMGTQKVLLIRFIPQVQIIFSVLNQIIPRCFNRWNSGFSKCRRMAPYPPREHTTESGHHRIDTRTVWTLSVDSFAAPIKTRGQDCKVLSSWNGLVGYGTKPPTKCSSSAVCRRIAQNCRCHSPALGIENGLHWILDVTFGEDACRVRSLHAPHNLALLRRFAVNALNRAGSNKPSGRSLSGQQWMIALCCGCWQPHCPTTKTKILAVNSF